MAASELLQKIKKNSTVKESAILAKSKFFNEKDMVPTSIPAINILLSGKLDGGLTPGLTIYSGVSKNFKTGFSLFLAKTYMEHYPESVLLFYDTEFGAPQSYFESFGIDTNRVLHTPIADIEQLKFDIMNQLNSIERGDHVIIIIDSIGNIASRKEVEDALNEKSVADMTRAKQLKSLFRMVTPYLNLKDIPLIAIGHVYAEQSLYPKEILSGGRGLYYAADNIYIVGRRQDKEGTEVVGYEFVVNVEKSRYVKEKSKIGISVNYESGLSKWSGLLDIALESGHITKPSNGWYSRVNKETGEIEDKKYRLKETNTSSFWEPILESPSFSNFIQSKYRVGTGAIMSDESFDNQIDELLTDEISVDIED